MRNTPDRIRTCDLRFRRPQTYRRKALCKRALWHQLSRLTPGLTPAMTPTPAAIKAELCTENPASRLTYEVDPDVLEHARREACEQPELPWDD